MFRGKRVDNGEWVEGVAFPHDNGMCTMFYQHPMDGSLEGKEVIPKTVEAYTSLTDKNGTKIFEGDIVDLGDETGVVSFNEGTFMVVGNTGGDIFYFPEILYTFEDTIEVIGNIHDTPNC